MKASVVILTKNPGPLFSEVLASVLDQETPWPYEIVVVDSGSRDGTVALCERTPGVKLHCIPPGEFGHGRTRNLAISLTSGDFIAMLTHDAKPADRNWLHELVHAVEQAPDIAGAFGRHLPYPGRDPFLARDLTLHFDNFARAPSIVRLDDPTRYAVDSSYRQFLHYFSDNNACLRRSVWARHPYPDVDFAEDQLWAKAVIEAGYAKAYADRARVYHSHEYGAWDRLRRCYDESRAFRRLFGYELAPSLGHAAAQILRCTLRDYWYWLSSGSVRRYPEWALKIPVHNLCRQIGYYLGTRAGGHPVGQDSLLSLDQSKKRQT